MSLYDRYRRLASHASTSDEIFKVFRSHEFCKHMVEGVYGPMASDCLNVIKKKYPHLLPYMKKFATNDTVGNPDVYIYDGVTISPTTMRYVRILGDILNEFGTLDGLNIIEIGVGYGGQCKIIHDYCKPASYTLVDYHEVLDLSRKFLDHFKVEGIQYKGMRGVEGKKFDLLISNFAFAEMPRLFQDYYAKRVIPNASKGFMICNIFGEPSHPKHQFTKGEITKLKSNSKWVAEVPMTGPTNAIYIWN